MLILPVLSSPTCIRGQDFLPDKRALQPEGLLHSRGMAGSGLPLIVQYSLLLPPVGVWTVFQFHCGGPPSQVPYPSSPWWAVTAPSIVTGTQVPPEANCSFHPKYLFLGITCGISGPFGPLSHASGQVTNALLTRWPLRPYCYNLRSTCMYEARRQRAS